MPSLDEHEKTFITSGPVNECTPFSKEVINFLKKGVCTVCL